MGTIPYVDRYAIFVGGVPRTTTAMELAQLFQQVISGVVEVTLEVERHTNYPRGSARVVFGTREAYLVALAMGRFTLFTLRERRILEMRPYVLDGMVCEICHEAAGIYLCPELPCMLYYCVPCWFMAHQNDDMDDHKPVSRRTLGLLKGWRQNQTLCRYGNCMPSGYYYF
ncbi:hypothetical protein LOAG_10914 [Loa loa]|nr:hypothetical protein LOAG_10914 [Loa loa]EFO17585.1 hypothetical protein LOAG_10914 [Loa loa]